MARTNPGHSCIITARFLIISPDVNLVNYLLFAIDFWRLPRFETEYDNPVQKS